MDVEIEPTTGGGGGGAGVGTGVGGVGGPFFCLVSLTCDASVLSRAPLIWALTPASRDLHLFANSA